jgi:hypothetical protein
MRFFYLIVLLLSSIQLTISPFIGKISDYGKIPKAFLELFKRNENAIQFVFGFATGYFNLDRDTFKNIDYITDLAKKCKVNGFKDSILTLTDKDFVKKVIGKSVKQNEGDNSKRKISKVADEDSTLGDEKKTSKRATRKISKVADEDLIFYDERKRKISKAGDEALFSFDLKKPVDTEKRITRKISKSAEKDYIRWLDEPKPDYTEKRATRKISKAAEKDDIRWMDQPKSADTEKRATRKISKAGDEALLSFNDEKKPDPSKRATRKISKAVEKDDLRLWDEQDPADTSKRATRRISKAAEHKTVDTTKRATRRISKAAEKDELRWWDEQQPENKRATRKISKAADNDDLGSQGEQKPADTEKRAKISSKAAGKDPTKSCYKQKLPHYQFFLKRRSLITFLNSLLGGVKYCDHDTWYGTGKITHGDDNAKITAKGILDNHRDNCRRDDDNNKCDIHALIKRNFYDIGFAFIRKGFIQQYFGCLWQIIKTVTHFEIGPAKTFNGIMKSIFQMAKSCLYGRLVSIFDKIVDIGQVGYGIYDHISEIDENRFFEFGFVVGKLAKVFNGMDILIC